MSEAEAPVATPAAPAAPATPAPAATPTPAEAAPSGQKPAESAPEARPGEEKPETPEQAEKRGKSRFERKINRLYREAAEQRARAELLERQLNEVKTPKAPEDPGAPKLQDFDFDPEKYAEAKAKYEAGKALKDHQAKEQTEAQRRAQAKIVESWTERVETAAEKYDDWDEVVGDLKPTTPWAMAIMEAENGADIAYHLGKNLKEAQRIAALPPLAAAREIGRLEERLRAAPQQEKKPSKAPPPIAPLSGAAPAETSPLADTSDVGKWIKARQKQVHSARR